jgi:peptidyl-tRNA hydrolase, PTH1 family
MTSTNLDKLFDALKGITRRADTTSSDSPETSEKTFLLVGLGNPGREYRDTRHNIGFMLMDKFANRLEVDFTRSQSKAIFTVGHYQGHKIILAKPQSFMNRSGHPTQAMLKFYKLAPVDLLVVYDDVDLPFDTLRLKPSGGTAGHKGMNSIVEQLGTKDFARLRLGVGRPPGHKQAANFVLKPFSKAEQEFLDQYLGRAADAILAYIREGVDLAMTVYNRNQSGQ